MAILVLFLFFERRYYATFSIIHITYTLHYYSFSIEPVFHSPLWASNPNILLLLVRSGHQCAAGHLTFPLLELSFDKFFGECSVMLSGTTTERIGKKIGSQLFWLSPEWTFAKGKQQKKRRKERKRVASPLCTIQGYQYQSVVVVFYIFHIHFHFVPLNAISAIIIKYIISTPCIIDYGLTLFSRSVDI